MGIKKYIGDGNFVNLGKLLRENTDTIKHLKSLLDKEGEYENFLGAVEFSIGENFIQNRKLKDKDVIIMLKNLKKNYLQYLNFFNEDLEKNILLRLSFELQDRKLTHHELNLVFNYVLWAIDNRSYMQDNQAYVKWIAYTFGLFEAEESEKYEKNFKKWAARLGIPKNKIGIMLLKDTKNIELGEQEKDNSRIESEFFALDEKEKFGFAVENVDEYPFLIDMYARELVEANDYQTAERFLKIILEKIPEFPPVEILLGMLYKEMGNNILAEHHLNNANRMLAEVPDEIFAPNIKKEMKEEIKRLLSNKDNAKGEVDFWDEGTFAETLGPKDIKEKMRTFHMKHDEEMNYDCKRCNEKISAHNKDWHDGMCDECFDKKYHSR